MSTTNPAPMSQSEFDEFCARWAAASPEVRSALAKHLSALEAPAAASGAGAQLPPLPKSLHTGKLKSAVGRFEFPLYTEPQMSDYARAALAAAPAAAQPAMQPAGWLIVSTGAGGQLCAQHYETERGAREALPHHSGGRAMPCYVPADAAPAAAQAQQWPKARAAGRQDDMEGGHLRIVLDNDNDVSVAVFEPKRGSAAVEFCNPGACGGGRSRRTRLALIELMRAIEADNADTPALAFPPAGATGEQQHG